MPELLAHQLRTCSDMKSVLDCVLNWGLEVTSAKRGDVQLIDLGAGCLNIEAQSGLHDEFLRFFARVKVTEGSACARALRNLGPTVIEDVWSDEQFAPYRGIADREGFRAVVSVPLVSAAGTVGVLSTHFPKCHRPNDLQLGALIRGAQVATNAIILRRARSRGKGDPRTDSAADVAETLRAISESDRRIRKADAILKKSDGLLRESRLAIVHSKQLVHPRH